MTQQNNNSYGQQNGQPSGQGQYQTGSVYPSGDQTIGAGQTAQPNYQNGQQNYGQSNGYQQNYGQPSDPQYQQPYQQNGQGYQQPQGYPQPGYAPQPGYQPQPGYYPPAQPVKKSGFPVWALLLLLIPALIIGGCIVISLVVVNAGKEVVNQAATAVSDGTGTINAASGLGGTVGPAEQVKPVLLDLPANPVRSFTYADMNITVKKAEISNQVLSNPPRYRADGAHLDITLTFTNPTSRGISINSALLQVTLADGSVYKKPFDFGVNQQDTQDQTFSFNVPVNATFSKAQLSLSQVGKEPLSIPLDGDVTATAYPVTLTANNTLNLKNPDVDYTIKSAVLDLNAHGERAPTGKRYLILTITIASHAPNGAYIGDDNFRLIVNGVAQAADYTDIQLQTGYKDVTTDSPIIFLIPDDAKTVQLQLGEKSQATTVPIDLTAKK